MVAAVGGTHGVGMPLLHSGLLHWLLMKECAGLRLGCIVRVGYSCDMALEMASNDDHIVPCRNLKMRTKLSRSMMSLVAKAQAFTGLKEKKSSLVREALKALIRARKLRGDWHAWATANLIWTCRRGDGHA